MSGPIEKAQSLRSLVGDESIPRDERLPPLFKALGEFHPAEMTEAACDSVTEVFARIEEVLAKYRSETGGDCKGTWDLDAEQVLQLIDATAQQIVAAELDGIVAGLAAGVRELPVEAIEEARQHRELMVPRLIEVLRETIAGARADEKPEGNAHFFALFLLSEFGAAEALPAIVEAVSLPGELPLDLFGDAVHSVLSRILAQFAGQRPEVIEGIVANQESNEYVRWAAARSYEYLVRDGRFSRDEAVERLEGHLRREIDRQGDVMLVAGLVDVLLDFAPEEALETITEAYRRDRVASYVVSLDDVERSIAEGEAGARRQRERWPAAKILDTIEELRHWACFEAERPQGRARPPVPHFTVPREPDEPAVDLPAEPEVSRGPRVGRNDPCTCGSGKKFKKCCGARKAQTTSRGDR